VKQFKIIDTSFKIYPTSNEKLMVDNENMYIEVSFNTYASTRISLRFLPYQCVIMTSYELHAINPRAIDSHLLEVENSQWLSSLERTYVKRRGRSPDYMKTARHFLVPFSSAVLEIAAWEYYKTEEINIALEDIDRSS